MVAVEARLAKWTKFVSCAVEVDSGTCWKVGAGALNALTLTGGVSVRVVETSKPCGAYVGGK